MQEEKEFIGRVAQKLTASLEKHIKKESNKNVTNQDTSTGYLALMTSKIDECLPHNKKTII